MSFGAVRFTKVLNVLMLGAVIAAGIVPSTLQAGQPIASWPTQPQPDSRQAPSAAAVSPAAVQIEAEQAELSGSPAAVGNDGNDVVYLQFDAASGATIPSPAVSSGITIPVTSFSFGAAGDHGFSTVAAASLNALARSATDFYLALGDLSYSSSRSESSWCDFVNLRVAESYPFEVLVGNHEETPAGPDGFIDNFAACLPDRLGVTGTYAHRYYFDYPAGTPLARFILIDPDLPRGSETAQYCTSGDTENCDWLKARIDEAKSQGLWTIVGMHKNCITIGDKSCEIGAGLLNMLVERNVDLILQGHDHSYQRSKQLSLSASCPALTANAFNADCVVDDGSDAFYSKGAGPVLVISAIFGRSSYKLRASDPEAPYFSTWMDPSLRSNGFMKFTVTKDMIDAQFVNVRGIFTDHFAVVSSVAPVLVCPSLPTGGGLATVSVDFPAAGNYRIWSRMMATDTIGSSYWLQIDGACPVQIATGSATAAATWQWIGSAAGNPAVVVAQQLGAGMHTVKLAGAEAAVRIDKLLFTTDAACVPTSATGDECLTPVADPAIPPADPSQPLPEGADNLLFLPFVAP